MTELKTLKDIDICPAYDVCGECEVVFVDNVKEEAIKLIKSINNDYFEEKIFNNKNDFLYKIPYLDKEKIFCKMILMNFFNITEEDLK